MRKVSSTLEKLWSEKGSSELQHKPKTPKKESCVRYLKKYIYGIYFASLETKFPNYV